MFGYMMGQAITMVVYRTFATFILTPFPENPDHCGRGMQQLRSNRA
jgi:hypothetical protein